jgi:hypothetical protein
MASFCQHTSIRKTSPFGLVFLIGRATHEAHPVSPSGEFGSGDSHRELCEFPDVFLRPRRAGEKLPLPFYKAFELFERILKNHKIYAIINPERRWSYEEGLR